MYHRNISLKLIRRTLKTVICGYAVDRPLIPRPNLCIECGMFRFKNAIFIVLIITSAISCDGFKIPKNIFDPSERAKYERSFEGPDSLMTLWKAEFSSAAQNKLTVTDGYSATVTGNGLYALGYSVELKKGDQLIIETDLENPETRIFIDVYDASSSAEPTETEVLKNGRFSRIIETTGIYKVILQPEIGYHRFSFKIYTQPSMGFPVAGKGSGDIQSFWGASRDGGGRSHEGVDIFASRGTPVVAATHGFITRTGNSGLGGKQVWQRDGILGSSLYYAHLDSIMVESGAQVKTGDTLGLVGSTGNAEGGAPHLHFGIYTAVGAVDPYPYLRKRSVPTYRKTVISNSGSIKSGSNLRSGPGTKYETVGTLDQKAPVTVLAGDGEWFHIRTESGTEGFVNSARLE